MTQALEVAKRVVRIASTPAQQVSQCDASPPDCRPETFARVSAGALLREKSFQSPDQVYPGFRFLDPPFRLLLLQIMNIAAVSNLDHKHDLHWFCLSAYLLGLPAGICPVAMVASSLAEI
eukprot:6280468-Amphidinium_carterae.1